MSKVLLVGAEGYIGSNCPFAHDWCDVKSGKDFLTLQPEPYDTIIFLAANLESTPGAYKYNEDLYMALDEWLFLYPATHVIYASSAAVYGEGDSPHYENDYLRPVNLYGESKLSGEYHVREYQAHTVLRFGNVYGQMNGQRGHGVTELFQDGEHTIYGDGSQVRDFVPISKIWQVIEAASNDWTIWQGVFNVSLNKPRSIREWYFEHRAAALDPIFSKAPEEIHTSMLNNAKMVAALAEGERDRE